MSAHVEVTAWSWWCGECGEGCDIAFDSESGAQRDAAAHDEEFHA